MKNLAEQYFAAINAEDWDGLGRVLAPDVELHTIGARPALGREALVARFRRILVPYSEHVDTVTRWVATSDTLVVCQISFVGMLDGRDVRFDALDVMDGTSEGIARIGIWYDTHDVVRQVWG